MGNITLAIPEELHKKMKKHSDIRWSEVARRSISNKVDELEFLDNLAEKNKLTQKDVDKIAEKVDSAVAKKLKLKLPKGKIGQGLWF